MILYELAFVAKTKKRMHYRSHGCWSYLVHNVVAADLPTLHDLDFNSRVLTCDDANKFLRRHPLICTECAKRYQKHAEYSLDSD
jgi:hypothetical protein